MILTIRGCHLLLSQANALRTQLAADIETCSDWAGDDLPSTKRVI